MNREVILTYCSQLEQNNNRAWFHENKAFYQGAVQAFESLLDSLMTELRKTDDHIPLVPPKELTFKLQRDTRFSHDKSPYNPCFRAHIAPKGKLPIPVGYYLLIRPGNRSFLGGGLFADMFQNATAMVRDFLVHHGEEWQQILSSPDFAAHFTVGGTALKNVPRGYDASHPQAQYLKNKSWYLEYPLSDEQICSPDFIPFAADVFTKMQPFNAYLNRALEGFEMPRR